MFDLEKIVRPSIRKLTAYSSARDEYKQEIANMLFLDANENPFTNGLNRYPDPQQSTIKKVLAEEKGLNTSQILLGNGSDEVLDLIFRAFCEPGKNAVITLPPTYGMYKVLADLNNVENKEVLLKKDFQPDVATILKKADDKTRILFLCSPNNPTGNVFDSDKIEKLVKDFKGIVVIDEAYIDFYAGESWVNFLSKFPNLVVTQTLSKAYGMAGIRLGICYASDAIISVLNKIKPPYNVNQLTQQKALERLQDKTLVQKEITQLLLERSKLISELEGIEIVDRIYPTDANFVLIKVDNATDRYNQLITKGIVVRNRTNQTLCENTLRITVGTSEENKYLIKAMKELVKIK